ncbi:type I restriction enzyme HsdR N-terminal domain-containing protein [Rhizobium oryzicola]|uniref:Type I restriction enzyme HsdR N-terminal domain-containing protein n=1 Tax=Rhizobium oryzicola TaxID=1232668 RepID=A0ABT8SRB7_9HYPH|nr:type I restriction enzyme HsdR N-terminal domain-containing protein [Rhizobium oryzicola]MDO1580976.1 type I restriction enzyme HsdR N-terminal domain-containing protein [Rhizobium oryzicola]
MMASRGFWDSVVEIADGNEADVETRIVLPLLQELGYDRDCIASKVPVTFQEGREKRPGRKPEADFVVYAERPFSRATSLIVVEAKRPNEPLGDGKDQGESYAQNLRTPILLMTNGQRLEIWQMQLTTESEKIFDCSVAEIAGKRAEIESLLSREALKDHCGALRHKRFDVAANDLGAYLSAEIERIGPITRLSIPRRLTRTDTNSTISALDLLTHNSRGALVLGMSGYGKTTLAKQLLHEALERRIEETSTILPFEIFLPDFTNSQSSLAGFLVERVASHKPGFTVEALLKIARDFGVLLLADGFDRVPLGQRGAVETALRQWMRDYPKTQTVIMSRKQSAPTDLSLPELWLEGYDVGDLRDLADRRSATELPEAKYVFVSAPHYIQNVSQVPLLAELVIQIYSTTRKYPTNLNALYEAWLNKILARYSSVERALDRVFLGELAEQTTEGPVSIEDAVAIGRNYEDSRQALERLSDADAIRCAARQLSFSTRG